MPRSALALLLVAGLALVAHRPALADDLKTVEGKRTLVTYPAGLEATATACRDALEAAIPIYEKALLYRLPEDQKLLVRLCESMEEYAAVVRPVAPDYVDNLAATLWKTGVSVLYVHPRPDPALLALTKSLPEQLRFLLCHEGVHQFLHKAGAKAAEWWPAWYGEGICDNLATECLLSNRPGEAPPPILLDDRAHVVRDLMLRDRALSLERLLHLNMNAVESERPMYAQAWSFFRLLASDPERLAALHRRIKKVPEPKEPAGPARTVEGEGALREALEAVYGPLGPLEERWIARAKATHSTWFEPLRASQRVAGNGIVAASYPGDASLLAAADPPPKAPFEFSCAMTILGGKKRQADLIFGYEHRDAPRYLKLALGSTGYATLLSYTDGRWQDRYRKSVTLPEATFAEGTAVRIRAVVGGGRIVLFVNDAKTFDEAVPPGFDVERGSWGLGAWDSIVLYENPRVAPVSK